MDKLIPVLVCVTPGKAPALPDCNRTFNALLDATQCYPCHPCSPDRVEGGSQCYPCNPCSPDRVEGGTQCYPCHPCSPDRVEGGAQCYPCNPCSPDRMSSDSSSSSGGCFLTSACVEFLNLPDDCDELQTLRAFRDRRIAKDAAFSDLVEQYYKIAPAIVRKIDASDDKKTIYEDLYKRLVLGAVELIKANKEDEAIALYTGIVRELTERYL